MALLALNTSVSLSSGNWQLALASWALSAALFAAWSYIRLVKSNPEVARPSQPEV
jgi:hypothetical protein